MIINMMSITDLREDIDNLTRKLRKSAYTVVYKNRTPLFVAVEPKWFEEKMAIDKVGEKDMEAEKRKQAVKYFRKMAKKLGDWKPTEKLMMLRDREYQRYQSWSKK